MWAKYLYNDIPISKKEELVAFSNQPNNDGIKISLHAILSLWIFANN